MIDHREPSFWGMAFCCGGTYLFAAFISMAIGIDPMTMAMG
jgi:hypothetical protein